MGKCIQCIHYRKRDGWHCALNTTSDLVERGYEIVEGQEPAPTEFSCDDFEGP